MGKGILVEEIRVYSEDFEEVFGRQPKGDELKLFAEGVRKGLSGHMNLKILFDCAKDYVEEIQSRKK